MRDEEGVFHCMIGGPPARPGQLRVARRGLEIRDGESVEVAPYGELALTLGGESGDYVYVRRGEQTLWTNAPGFVDALRAIGAPELAPQLDALAQSSKRHSWRARAGVAIFFAFIAGCLALVAAVPSIFRASVGAHTPDVERMLGDAAGEDIVSGARLTSPEIASSVEALVARLVAHAAGAEGYEFRVEVRSSSDVNAFALPGGRVVVLRGLLGAAESPDEVFGVLAHEIAHVTHRDGLRAAARSAGFFLALSMILGDDGSALLALAGDAARVVGENAYSRDAESAADAEGARTMAAAGYDPLGMARLFERLERTPGTELPHALAWLSTHPEHRERVAAVRELAPTLARGPVAPPTCDWSALRRSLGEGGEPDVGLE